MFLFRHLINLGRLLPRVLDAVGKLQKKSVVASLKKIRRTTISNKYFFNDYNENVSSMDLIGSNLIYDFPFLSAT